MYALFKNGKQESKSYDRANKVMLVVVMLHPWAFNEDNQFKDGYEIKKLPSADILDFRTRTKKE